MLPEQAEEGVGVHHLDVKVRPGLAQPRHRVDDRRRAGPDDAEEVEARGARIIAVGTEGDTRLPELVTHFIGVPPSIEILNPVLCNIPQQLFAYYCALYRGCEIDKPRNLAKSVTVE